MFLNKRTRLSMTLAGAALAGCDASRPASHLDAASVSSDFIASCLAYQEAKSKGVGADTELGKTIAALIQVAGTKADATCFDIYLQLDKLVFRVNPLTGRESDEGWVDLSGRGLTTIAPLQNFRNIRHLRLGGNQLTSLIELETFHDLNDLNISGNRIESLFSLAGSVTLERLDASDNKLTSLIGLGKLSNLTALNASGNALTDLGALAETKAHLASLDLSANPSLTDKALTAVLPRFADSMTSLKLDGTLFRSTDVLKDFSTLFVASFAQTKVESLDFTATAPQLTALDVSGTAVDDHQLNKMMFCPLAVLLAGDNPGIVDAAAVMAVNFPSLRVLSLANDPQVADGSSIARISTLKVVDLVGTQVPPAAFDHNYDLAFGYFPGVKTEADCPLVSVEKCRTGLENASIPFRALYDPTF